MFWHVTGTSSPFTATKPTLLKTDRALLSHDKQHRLWWYPDAADSFNPISSQWKRFNRVRFCFVQRLHLNGIYDVNWKILVFKNTFVNFFTVQSDQILLSFGNDLSIFLKNIVSRWFFKVFYQKPPFDPILNEGNKLIQLKVYVMIKKIWPSLGIKLAVKFCTTQARR